MLRRAYDIVQLPARCVPTATATDSQLGLGWRTLSSSELFLPRFGYRGIFVMLAVTIALALLLLLRLIQRAALTTCGGPCPRLMPLVSVPR
jgi:hypothetical protein